MTSLSQVLAISIALFALPVLSNSGNGPTLDGGIPIGPEVAENIGSVYGVLERQRARHQLRVKQFSDDEKAEIDALSASLTEVSGLTLADCDVQHVTNQAANLRDRLAHLLVVTLPKTKRSDQLRLLYHRTVQPFPQPGLESLPLGDIQVGKTMLQSFFGKLIRNGRNKQLEAQLAVSQAEAMLNLTPESARWLGIGPIHANLTRVHRNLLQKNQQAADALQEVLASVADKELHDLASDLDTDLKQTIQATSSQILEPLAMAAQLQPYLEEIRDRLAENYRDLFPKNPPETYGSMARCFALWGRAARRAATLYRLTSWEQDLAFHMDANPTEAGTWMGRLVPHRNSQGRALAGLSNEPECLLVLEGSDLVPVRFCHYQLFWCLPGDADTKEPGSGRGKSRRMYDTGVRFFDQPTRLTRGESGDWKLAALSPGTAEPRVALTTLNQMLQQRGLAPYLEVIRAWVTLNRQGLSMELELIMPALSTEITETLSFLPKTTDLKRVSPQIASDLVEALNRQLQRRTGAGFLPRYSQPGLADSKRAAVAAIREVERPGVGRSPLVVTMDHRADLMGWPVPVIRRFLVERERLVPIATTVDPVLLKVAVLNILSGRQPQTASWQAYVREINHLTAWRHQVSRQSAELSQTLAKSLQDQLIQFAAAAIPEKATLARHFRQSLDPGSLEFLLAQKLPSQTWIQLFSQGGELSEPALQFLSRLLQDQGQPACDWTALQWILNPKSREKMRVLLSEHGKRVVFPALIRQGIGHLLQSGLTKAVAQVVPSSDVEEAAAFYFQALAPQVAELETVMGERQRLDMVLRNLAGADLFSWVTLSVEGLSVGRDGQLIGDLSLMPQVFRTIWPEIEDAIKAGSGARGTLPEHRESLTSALGFTVTVTPVFQAYREAAHQMNREIREAWTKACQAEGLLNNPGRGEAVLTTMAPQIHMRADPEGLGLLYDGQDRVFTGFKLAIPFVDLNGGSEVWELLRPLNDFMATREVFWKSLQSDLQERARNLADGILQNEAGSNALLALAQIRQGVPYEHLTDYLRHSLPETCRLFGQDLTLTYAFEQGRLRVTTLRANPNGYPFGEPFRVIGGLSLDLDAPGGPQVRVNWNDLSTDPELAPLIQQQVEGKLGLTLGNVVFERGAIGLDFSWVPEGLALPVFGQIAIDVNRLNTSGLIDLVVANLRAQLEKRLKQGKNLPAFGPFQLTGLEPLEETDHPLAFLLKGILTLGDVDIAVELTSRPGRRLDLKLTTGNLRLPENPIVNDLGIEALFQSKAGYSAEGGFRLYLSADVVADLAGTPLILKAKFYLDRHGLHFLEAIEIELDGWLDSPEGSFALGNLRVSIHPETRQVRLSCSLAQDADSAKKLVVNLAGKFRIGDTDLFFRGNLFILKAGVADVKVRLSIPEKIVVVNLRSTFLPRLLFELKGELTLRQVKEEKDYAYFMDLEAEILGLELFGAHAKLTKAMAGSVWCTFDWPLNLTTNKVHVDFKKDLEDPTLEFSSEKGVKGFATVKVSANINEQRCFLSAGAKIAGVNVTATLRLLSPRGLTLAQILKALVDQGITLNLPTSFATGGTGDSEKKGASKKSGSYSSSLTGSVRKSKTKSKPTKVNDWTKAWDKRPKKSKKTIFWVIPAGEKKTETKVFATGPAETLFRALGLDAEKTAKKKGYYKVLADYALALTGDGKLRLFKKSGGTWAKTNWELNYQTYRDHPKADNLEVLKQDTKHDLNLAVIKIQGNTLAVKSGATLRTPAQSLDPNTIKNINSSVASLNGFEGKLSNSMAWWLGYFHFLDEPVSAQRVESVCFAFAGKRKIAMFPASNGHLVMVAFVLPGSPSLRNVPEPLPYLKGLENYSANFANVPPPGAGLLVCGNRHGVLIQRDPGSTSGPLWFLNERGLGKSGRWELLEPSCGEEINEILDPAAGPKKSLIVQMIDGIPSQATDLRWVMGHQVEDSHRLRIGVSYKLGDPEGISPHLAFGDARLLTGGIPKIYTIPWYQLQSHWTQHASFLPARPPQTEWAYCRTLVGAQWQNDGWRANPLGPLLIAKEQP